MHFLINLAVLITSFLIVIGTSGCDQAAEEAKSAASGLITQSVNEAKQAIGLGSGDSKEGESENEKEGGEANEKGDGEGGKED